MDITGTHSARPLTAVLGETKDGNPQVAVEFEITDIDGHPHTTWFGALKSEASEEITFKALRNCGWTGADWTDIHVSGEVSLVIELVPYNGKTTQKVKWVNKPGGVAMVKRMDAGKAAAFNARMKGRLLAFDQKSGTSVAPQKAANPPPPLDSDAPPF